jgi:hypothetical protein
VAIKTNIKIIIVQPADVVINTVNDLILIKVHFEGILLNFPL